MRRRHTSSFEIIRLVRPTYLVHVLRSTIHSGTRSPRSCPVEPEDARSNAIVSVRCARRRRHLAVRLAPSSESTPMLLLLLVLVDVGSRRSRRRVEPLFSIIQLTVSLRVDRPLFSSTTRTRPSTAPTAAAAAASADSVANANCTMRI